ncbi:MAG: hypothetical protein ACK2UP_03100 [Candidatus Promineifilaceae bacterium]
MAPATWVALGYDVGTRNGSGFALYSVAQAATIVTAAATKSSLSKDRFMTTINAFLSITF